LLRAAPLAAVSGLRHLRSRKTAGENPSIVLGDDSDKAQSNATVIITRTKRRPWWEC
jgi:hypothetical protein